MEGVNTYEIGSIVDPYWLSDTILHESTIGGFWTKFLRENYVTDMGFESVPLVGNVEKTKATFSGAPIETFGEFEKGGLDEIAVPIKRRYRGLPRHGRSTLQGTGEGVDWLYRKVKLWNSKKAFAIPVEGSVDQQILRKQMADAIEKEVRPAAAEWLRDYTEGAINWTILTGYSPELTTLRGEIQARDTGIINYSHPNIYVATHGKVVHGTDSDTRPMGAGYEDNIVAAANQAMAAGPSVAGLTTERLVAFRNDMMRTGIRPVQTAMGPMWCVALKDSAYTQLSLEMGDRKYRDTMIQSLPQDLKSNPFFGGAVAVYEHCIIYQNPLQFGIQLDGSGRVIQHSGSTIGMPAYGPSGDWVGSHTIDATIDQSDLAVNIGFGAGFLTKAYGKKRMWFTGQKWDHDQNDELGMHWWCSYMRSDVTDPLNKLGYGVDAFAYHDASALLITCSPFLGGY